MPHRKITGLDAPLVESSLAIYSRFEMGGAIRGDETDILQIEERRGEELASNIMRATPLKDVGVRFHPAGSIVGVEVFTNLSTIDRDTVDEIVRQSRDYLEDAFGETAELKAASRREPAVEIRVE